MTTAPMGGTPAPDAAPGAPARALARFVAQVEYHSLPPAVRQHATLVLLDMLGVMIWGAQDAFLGGWRSQLARLQSGGKATVFGTTDRLDPASAAMLNAAACTVTQIDEGHRPSRGHPGIHVIPAALAVAEAEGASGERLIEAIVAGYEVAVRMGRAVAPVHSGVHVHGHWGTIGAAVAAAKVLGASEAALVQVIEAAAALVIYPPADTAVDGSTVHHLFVGTGVRTAIEAAYGLAAGLTGTTGTLERFFGPRSSDQFKAERLTEAIGGPDDPVIYEILNNYFKFFPVCAHTITTIEALASLRLQVPDLEQIARVTVRTYGGAAELCRQDVGTPLGSKFSLPCIVAARLLNPAGTARELHDVNLADPRLQRLMRLVDVVLDPELALLYPEARPAIVQIDMKDGSRLTERRMVPYGDADNPAPVAAVEEKFTVLVAPVLGQAGAERLQSLVRRSPHLVSLADLTKAAARAPDHDDAKRGGVL